MGVPIIFKISVDPYTVSSNNVAHSDSYGLETDTFFNNKDRKNLKMKFIKRYLVIPV